VNRGRVVVLAALAAALLSACTSSTPNHGGDSARTPTKIIPAPADVVAGTAPQLNGNLWVLAGPVGDRTLHQLDLTTDKFGPALPAAASATSLTQSNSTLLGLGLATVGAGALQFLNGANGALVSTVALAAPVREVTAGSDGSTFFALEGTTTSSSVAVISSIAKTVKGTLPVPLDTVSIAVDPDQQRVYALESDGNVDIISGFGQVISRFSVGNNPEALALSGDGATMYVLKSGHGDAQNVGVFNVSLESQTEVFPAPSDTNDIEISSDGATLYAFVGTSTVGNVQLFATG
jgi:DNA-binding beta-propeller fold protein YncE